MSTDLVVADRTVDVFFKDETWVLWHNDSDRTTAEQMECCEWYEWVDGEWEMRRRSGMSCLGFGITVLSKEREVLNPIFSESPLAPENGPLDNNGETYNSLISDGRFEGTAFPCLANPVYEDGLLSSVEVSLRRFEIPAGLSSVRAVVLVFVDTNGKRTELSNGGGLSVTSINTNTFSFVLNIDAIMPIPIWNCMLITQEMWVHL